MVCVLPKVFKTHPNGSFGAPRARLPAPSQPSINFTRAASRHFLVVCTCVHIYTICMFFRLLLALPCACVPHFIFIEQEQAPTTRAFPCPIERQK